LSAPLHAVHRLRGLGPYAGLDCDTEPRLSRAWLSLSDSSITRVCRSRHASYTFPAPPTQQPQAPRMARFLGLTGPALGLSQPLSGLRNLRLHGPVSCRLRPWDSCTPSEDQPDDQAGMRRTAHLPGRSSREPRNEGRNLPTANSRSLWRVPPLKHTLTELRNGSHRQRRPKTTPRSPRAVSRQSKPPSSHAPWPRRRANPTPQLGFRVSKLSEVGDLPRETTSSYEVLPPTTLLSD